ncbi:GNAT family N-acetyltransferase [Acuticoccus sp. MNP-M23]|uniref:GNAT family N-acetyltransferase n=1 Tax=Acuticoccus sp. MNP-M23 TaxID=3072793 RepID=UPI002815270A|nr:GNAT family N-acetyltransferase [Acuticoccus sp. MNP-M23]WMS44919.1 GNAT family N-acetyltransferase [Acuticoccus sp. MNP-M23]
MTESTTTAHETGWLTRPTLSTERLVLRAPAARDREPLIALAGSPDVSRWLSRVPHPYTAADADYFLADAADATIWAIADAGSDALMGTIALHPLDLADEPGSAEIGYWLGMPYWGNGYGLEAVRRIVDHAFAHPGVPAVRARYAGANAPSARILAKVGFTPVTAPMIVGGPGGSMCDTEVVLYRP